jgi:hypothetical protein
VANASLQSAASSGIASRAADSASCPPHYWLISQDDRGERWDCHNCANTKRPPQTRATHWGERACTWSREERILAGITEE